MLTHALKRELLGIARSSIATALQPKPARNSVAPSPELLQPSGAFVTLRIHHELRGCIGYMDSSLPLAEVVAEVSRKAAFDDPRFPALTLYEFDRVTLEISVISLQRRVCSKDEVTVGEHGVVIELGSSRGVLLPQVATENDWNAEQFLDALCRKSGLHALAWQDPDAKICVFTAEVIKEDEVLREHPA